MGPRRPARPMAPRRPAPGRRAIGRGAHVGVVDRAGRAVTITDDHRPGVDEGKPEHLLGEDIRPGVHDEIPPSPLAGPTTANV